MCRWVGVFAGELMFVRRCVCVQVSWCVCECEPP